MKPIKPVKKSIDKIMGFTPNYFMRDKLNQPEFVNFAQSSQFI